MRSGGRSRAAKSPSSKGFPEQRWQREERPYSCALWGPGPKEAPARGRAHGSSRAWGLAPGLSTKPPVPRCAHGAGEMPPGSLRGRGGCSDRSQPPNPFPQDPRLPCVFSKGISDPLTGSVAKRCHL